jgi:ABC-type dipeptide/oligopeptide/nickel transport system ATPase component
VDGVSLRLAAGETLALVGESGCGKSITALSVMGLVPHPAGRIAGGSIRLEGRELVGQAESVLEKLRGDRMAMIFQEPMTSLNPVLTVGRQIGETLMLHEGLSAQDAEKRSIEMLNLVGIPEAARRVKEYPHQLSGGMRQRAALARTLAVDPHVLLMDEPFSALDAQTKMVLQQDLARSLAEHNKTTLFITHDLIEAIALSDRILVMSRRPGRIIEEIPVDLPNRADPMSRREHPRVTEYMTKLMSLLHIGDLVDAPI